MSVVDDARDAVPPSLRAELVVLTAGAALLVVGHWAERRYRRWGRDASPFTAPRARAAAFRSSIRRKRSGFGEASQVIGEIFAAIEELRSRQT